MNAQDYTPQDADNYYVTAYSGTCNVAGYVDGGQWDLFHLEDIARFGAGVEGD